MGFFRGILTFACLLYVQGAYASQPLPAPHRCSPDIKPYYIPSTSSQAFDPENFVPTGLNVGDLEACAATTCTIAPVTGPFKYEGRFVDNSIGGPNGVGYKPTVAIGAVPAPEMNRLYMHMGAVLGAYRMSSFQEDIQAPMGSGALYGACYDWRGLHPHGFFLDWRSYVFPDWASSGWFIFGNTDGSPAAEAMTDFDYDDRGYIYIAYGDSQDYFFGIVHDAQQNEMGQQLPLVAQVYKPSVEASANRFPRHRVVGPNEWVNIRELMHLRSGDRHYVLGYGPAVQGHYGKLWDVTDPVNPVRAKFLDLPQIARTGSTSAKVRGPGGHVLAVIPDDTLNNSVQIYDAASIVAPGVTVPSPSKVFTTDGNFSYKGITTDGTRFYAVSWTLRGANIRELGHRTRVTVFSPSADKSAASFQKTLEVELNEPFLSTWIGYGAGYIILRGQKSFIDDSNPVCSLGVCFYDVMRFFKLEGTSLVEVETDNYLTKFYSAPGSPGRFISGFSNYVSLRARGELWRSSLYLSGGKKFLIQTNYNLGDLYEFKAQ